MISRRQALRMLASATAVTTLAPEQIAQARAVFADDPGAVAGERRFFTDGEWETVPVLADMILPADERSVGATAAKVPEFIDFILSEYREQAVPIRGGLAWLRYESLDRYERRFAECSVEQRKGILDEIAWPDRAPKRMRHGVLFFNRFRDLVASGFWSSRIGVADLQYIGNVFAPGWEGCPPEQLRKLGLIE